VKGSRRLAFLASITDVFHCLFVTPLLQNGKIPLIELLLRHDIFRILNSGIEKPTSVHINRDLIVIPLVNRIPSPQVEKVNGVTTRSEVNPSCDGDTCDIVSIVVNELVSLWSTNRIAGAASFVVVLRMLFSGAAKEVIKIESNGSLKLVKEHCVVAAGDASAYEPLIGVRLRL
jgi:hypothetical protein